jgi:acyl-coenzyme A synthetase/AMP-(fatty) acid ligase
MTLRDHLKSGAADRKLSDPRWIVALSDAATGSILSGRAAELADRSVLVAMADQLTTALAMFELDGVARRMLLCPPDLRTEHLASVVADAEIDAVVCDQPAIWQPFSIPVVVTGNLPIRPAASAASSHETEWLLLTSGTTGAPKVVNHTLAGLTGAITAEGPSQGPPPAWATFYDIRRYGGLQIFLRAVVGGGSMVLSDPKESISDHLARLIKTGVTHISGTPSHWRKALMSAGVASFRPRYVRLSGEIADQAVLDALRKAFPFASIGHAFASTEAGVGFAVNDGLEGFPAALLTQNSDGVEMKVEDGSLRIRSNRTAHSYVGHNAAALADADGFIDTGDMVELKGDRYYFVGRRGGIINVGGLKVHPEEVEAVINRHQGVRMSRVRSRKSPITGAIVVADVVLAGSADETQAKAIRDDIVADCRQCLAPHKVPAMISFVASLDVTDAGKLARNNA